MARLRLAISTIHQGNERTDGGEMEGGLTESAIARERGGDEN
jgi:hypothetical protein